jgi:hypothetical protein
VHCAEEEQRPDDCEAPDVGCVVQVAGVGAVAIVDGERPVQRRERWGYVVWRRWVLGSEGVEKAAVIMGLASV